MIVIDDLGSHYDGTYRSLYNLDADALGLRLHAFCRTDQCPDMSEAQVLITFYLRHNRQWLPDEEMTQIKDYDTSYALLDHCHKSYALLDHCHKSYLFPHSELFDQDGFTPTVQGLLSEMGLPDTAEIIDSWSKKIIYFAHEVALLAKAKKTYMATVAIQFGTANPDSGNPCMDRAGMVEEECPVCFDALDKGELVILPCAHKFHCNCLCQWFEQRFQCPICRSDKISRE